MCVFCVLYCQPISRSVSTPPLSPSSTEVRYCVSGRPFLTVSNAHQIPQVGGLRGLIGYNAFTYTKGLREEITFKVAPALHCTSGPPLAFSLQMEILWFIRPQIESKAPNPSWSHLHTSGKFWLIFSLILCHGWRRNSSKRSSLGLVEGLFWDSDCVYVPGHDLGMIGWWIWYNAFFSVV